MSEVNKMKDVRITVIRRAEYNDLIEKYENPIEHACEMREGQVFVSKSAARPDGICECAWGTLEPWVRKLAEGGGNFYDGWMKNPKSGMFSCNDGFRPVSYLIEAME